MEWKSMLCVSIHAYYNKREQWLIWVRMIWAVKGRVVVGSSSSHTNTNTTTTTTTTTTTNNNNRDIIYYINGVSFVLLLHKGYFYFYIQSFKCNKGK